MGTYRLKQGLMLNAAMASMQSWPVQGLSMCTAMERHMPMLLLPCTSMCEVQLGQAKQLYMDSQLCMRQLAATLLTRGRARRGMLIAWHGTTCGPSNWGTTLPSTTAHQRVHWARLDGSEMRYNGPGGLG